MENHPKSLVMDIHAPSRLETAEVELKKNLQISFMIICVIFRATTLLVVVKKISGIETFIGPFS